MAATDVGAVGEVVRDGPRWARQETGYLAPPNDADALASKMLAIMNDREQANIRALRGQRLIRERYSLGAMADSVENVYETLLGGVKR